MPSKIVSRTEAENFVDRYDTFLFDCDGVLWTGATLLPHVKETLALLRSRGKKLLFVTNNSTQSRASYAKKFAKFGIPADISEVFCSAYSSAVYLSKVVKFPKDKKVLVVGEEGLEDELKLAGITVVGGTDPALNRLVDAAEVPGRDETIACVLAGLDRHINYTKIGYAQAQLLDKETLFLATNIDSTFPAAGRILPGAGTVVQAIATCSGREPQATMGKPDKAMMESIKAANQFDPTKAVMVGDRLNTDIAFGRNGGLGTLMVLTGIESEETLENSTAVKPDYYMNSIGQLAELLEPCSTNT